MKIRFLVDRTVRDEARAVVASYRKGQTVDLPHASAFHWLNRGAAEEIVAKAEPERVKRSPKAVAPPSEGAGKQTWDSVIGAALTESAPDRPAKRSE